MSKHDYWDVVPYIDGLKTVVLERMYFGAHTVISRARIMEGWISVEDAIQHVGDDLGGKIVRFIGAMPSDPPTETTVDVTFEYPEDWWQAFRQRWWPRRWLTTRPVRMRRVVKHVTVHLRAVYPQLDQAFPGRGPIKFVLARAVVEEKP